jgi:protoporphyrin/coproporphyrin ferrochelatase
MQQTDSHSQNKLNNVGIVLLNMGGPKTLEDVQPFLFNLFADPDIINLPFFMKPFQKQLAWLIARNRSKGTKEMYQHIGNGSPILEITENLAQKIEQELKDTFNGIKTNVAMRYTYPRAEDAIKQLKENNVENLILFSQYPHYADSTTLSSIKDFHKAALKLNFQPKKIIEIDEWGLEPEYISWWVNGIINTIKEKHVTLDKSVHLIFSAHGLPKRYVDKGEKYPFRIQKSVAEVIDQLGDDIISKINYHISYQSRAGPLEWTKPYTDDLIEEIVEKDAKTIIIVPFGFVSNHVETLFEIDILYGDLAKEKGIENYYRVEVPDDDDAYAKAITKMILRKIEG